MAKMIEDFAASIFDYIGSAKQQHVAWRTILHNNFHRNKKLGGPINPILEECIKTRNCRRDRGGPAAYEAVLYTESSYQPGDGRPMHMVSASFNNKKEAVDDVCHRTMARLLTQNAHAVLLHQLQWSVPTQEVVMEVVRIKEAAVYEEREAGTYVGTR